MREIKACARLWMDKKLMQNETKQRLNVNKMETLWVGSCQTCEMNRNCSTGVTCPLEEQVCGFGVLTDPSLSLEAQVVLMSWTVFHLL